MPEIVHPASRPRNRTTSRNQNNRAIRQRPTQPRHPPPVNKLRKSAERPHRYHLEPLALVARHLPRLLRTIARGAPSAPGRYLDRKLPGGRWNAAPRTPATRRAPWSHHTFRTLFPGAQWLGDGTSIAVRWNDQIFVFNVEALLDPAADALVGFAVSDAEDEEALHLAFKMSQETAGRPPLAISLDNRPSNHSPGAVVALADTIPLRSTPGRGQAKAPLEGAFGLFQQAMPPLLLVGNNQKEIARCVLELVMTAWARGRNGKPRKRLGGRTPAQVYNQDRPTPEEIKEALDWFQELARRQERARLTREARRDSVRLTLLTQGLEELGIPDPDRRIAVDLAIYAREAIARGLATFRAKQDLGTVPPDAEPARYLGGIIRQLHIRLELEQTSSHLLEQRIRLGDLTLKPLHAAAEALRALPANQRSALYPNLCRRIAASFKTDRERRANLIDQMAEAVASAA